MYASFDDLQNLDKGKLDGIFLEGIEFIAECIVNQSVE